MDGKLYGLLKALINKSSGGDISEIQEEIDELYSLLAGKLYLVGETSTIIEDQSTINPIMINGVSTTAVNGNLVIYNRSEFVFDGTKWIALGDLSSLGNLAYKNSASAAYTPIGTVSQPSFTGSESTVTVKGTPAGTVSQPTFTGTQATIKTTITAKGTITKPDIAVSPATTIVNSITDVGTLPVLSTTVSSENLTISFNSGRLPTKGSNTAVMTGATARLVAVPTFTGSEVIGSVSYTPSGTISKPTFTGNELSSSGAYTPSGTISQPTFTGTEDTIISR